MAERSRASRSNPFSQRSHERIVSLPGSLDGADISIDELSDCEVFILDYTSAVYVDECSNCQIQIGPISSFCYIRNCSNCKVSIACQQFRAKDCRNITVFLFSTSDPHIEECSAILFGPYNLAYPLQDTHFAKAGLNPAVNKWSQVYDHSPSSGDEERHWTIMEPEDFAPITYEIEDLGKPVDPVQKPNRFAKNGAKGVVLVGSQAPSKTKPEKKDILPPPADIIIEDPSGELSNQDLPALHSVSEAPLRNIWGAPSLPSQVSDEEDLEKANNSGQPQAYSLKRLSKTSRTPLAEFSPFENPVLTSPSPRSDSDEVSEVRLCYTHWQEFRHAVSVPGLRVPPAYLQNTLRRISEKAQPYHEQIRMYTISAFCILLTGLFLLLMIVLLYDFVGMYDEGLEFQLIALALITLGLFLYVIAKLVGTIKRGNRDFKSLLTQETAMRYINSGLEFRGDLYTLRILTASNTLQST